MLNDERFYAIHVYWKSVELESFMAWVEDNEIFFIILCMMLEGAEYEPQNLKHHRQQVSQQLNLKFTTIYFS